MLVTNGPRTGTAPCTDCLMPSLVQVMVASSEPMLPFELAVAGAGRLDVEAELHALGVADVVAGRLHRDVGVVLRRRCHSISGVTPKDAVAESLTSHATASATFLSAT